MFVSGSATGPQTYFYLDSEFRPPSTVFIVTLGRRTITIDYDGFVNFDLGDDVFGDDIYPTVYPAREA